MHFGNVGVDASRHPPKPGKMHREKRQVKSKEEKPEMPLSRAGIEQTARDFRPPVIQTAKHRKDGATYKHVVEMRHHEKSVVDLGIDRNQGLHDSRKAAD